MQATEFITKLQDLVSQHGDIMVINADGDEVDVEFNDDGADALVIE